LYHSCPFSTPSMITLSILSGNIAATVAPRRDPYEKPNANLISTTAPGAERVEKSGSSYRSIATFHPPPERPQYSSCPSQRMQCRQGLLSAATGRSMRRRAVCLGPNSGRRPCPKHCPRTPGSVVRQMFVRCHLRSTSTISCCCPSHYVHKLSVHLLHPTLSHHGVGSC
jgi:hypothetical protein